MNEWTDWKAFPDPRKNDIFIAPFGPGVYDLQNKKTGEPILFGSGKNCAFRMSSLLPKPFGCGTRKNIKKREYVLEQLLNVVYRVLPCADVKTARKMEKQLREEKSYLFPT
ncbi:hypothetical protein [uncultured Microbulbifer sp.]|uniref:hypothetical protein n=1 Tax=uncultured Microbulbifer sp. TaxID=348147 RepID=UPI002601998A|nr:hypothetical protein [uncultured Microbulbifer sp.]